MKVFARIKLAKIVASFLFSPLYVVISYSLLLVDHHRILCTHIVLALIFGRFAVFIKTSIRSRVFIIRHAHWSISGLKNTNEILEMIVFTAFSERLNQAAIYEGPGILLLIASNVLPAWEYREPFHTFMNAIVPFVRVLCSIFNWDALYSRNDKWSDDARSHFSLAVSNFFNYYSNNFFLLINKYLLLYITYFRASLKIIKINMAFLMHTKIIQRRFFQKFPRFSWIQGP